MLSGESLASLIAVISEIGRISTRRGRPASEAHREQPKSEMTLESARIVSLDTGRLRTKPIVLSYGGLSMLRTLISKMLIPKRALLPSHAICADARSLLLCLFCKWIVFSIESRQL